MKQTSPDSILDHRSWVFWCGGLLAPVACTLLATACIHWWDMDRAVSGLWYDPVAGRWPLLHAPASAAVYDWASFPALFAGVLATAIAAGSLFSEELRKWRGACLLFLLVLWLGPGLLVNTVLKTYVGRPRPVQIVEFGGFKEYQPALSIHFDEQFNSFPSGHASMGFVFLAPAFCLYRRRPRLALAFLILGLGLGGGIGFVRVIQGRHFLTDVLWSGLIVYLTAFLLHVAMGFHRLLPVNGSATKQPRRATPKVAPRLSASLAAAAPEGAAER